MNKSRHMFRFLVICMTCLMVLSYASQTITDSSFLKRIEKSNNYKQNIVLLENVLNKPHSINAHDLLMQEMLINNYIHLSQFEKATSLCQKEILIAKKNKWLFNEATLYQLLAKTYYHLNQRDQFLLYNKKCLKIAEENQYYELLKKCNHNLGVIALENENNYPLAESYFLKAIVYGEKTVADHKNNLGGNYRLLATTYDLQGKYKKADSVFLLSAEIFKLHHDSLGLAGVLCFHARMFQSSNQYDKALELSKESIRISKLIKNDDYTQTALSIYAQIQSHLENYKEAYNASNEILTIETARSRNNLKIEIAESEAKFKVAELKNKEELLELQSKQSKQNYLYIFLLVFILTLASLIIIYQKKTTKREQFLKLRNLSEVYDAEEKERSRIAKDLHDNMGAYATSLLAQIDSVELSSEERKTKKIKSLRIDAENIMSTLRETIWILKTKTISTQQFSDLVKIYMDKHLTKNAGLNVSYSEELGNMKYLSPTVSLNLYRIIQEMIQNIIKHASAKHVQFILISGEFLVLEIIDDGIGFNTTNSHRKSGLENMTFRANEINFQLNITSQPGEGTSIRVEELA